MILFNGSPNKLVIPRIKESILVVGMNITTAQSLPLEPFIRKVPDYLVPSVQENIARPRGGRDTRRWRSRCGIFGERGRAGRATRPGCHERHSTFVFLTTIEILRSRIMAATAVVSFAHLVSVVGRTTIPLLFVFRTTG
jgi:hypothetical protein